MPRLLRNPKLHYSLQNNNPLLCILNQTKPYHSHILLINTTLPSKPISPKGFLLCRFSNQIFVYITNFLKACCMPRLFITPHFIASKVLDECFKLWNHLYDEPTNAHRSTVYYITLVTIPLHVVTLLHHPQRVCVQCLPSNISVWMQNWWYF
jgi:hypothetical protein